MTEVVDEATSASARNKLPANGGDEEEQKDRAYLRSSFLRCITRLAGNNCEITTVEGTSITGQYNGMDLHGQDIFLKQLRTPVGMGVLQYALVRTTDIINVHMPCVNLKPHDSCS